MEVTLAFQIQNLIKSCLIYDANFQKYFETIYYYISIVIFYLGLIIAFLIIAIFHKYNDSGYSDKINSFGKQLAMHIAASNPISLTSDEIQKEIID